MQADFSRIILSASAWGVNELLIYITIIVIIVVITMVIIIVNIIIIVIIIIKDMKL